MAMFSTSRSSQPTSNHLVEFKAGKCVLKPGSAPDKKIVSPKPAKGMVFIKQSDDMLMHFCWKNRETGTVEDDLIIFPGDIDFIKIKECTTGRVCVLKFKNSDRRLFFWIQEGKTDKDDENCRKVNDLLNNPPAPGSRVRGASAGGSAEQQSVGQALGLGAGTDDLNALSQLDGNQLTQLLNLMGGGAGGGAGALGFDPAALLGQATPQTTAGTTPHSTITSTPTVPTPTTISGTPSAPARVSTAQSRLSSNQPAIQLSDLQSILQGMNLPASGPNEPAIDLEETLTGSNLSQSVAEPENQSRLLTHLPNEPPVTQNREELNETIHSPQFRQAVGLFGMALQSGQLGPVMQQFGLPQEAVDAANKGDLESFAEQLQQSEATPGISSTEQKKQEKTTDGEESSEKSATGFEPPKPKKGKHDGSDEDRDNMDLD